MKYLLILITCLLIQACGHKPVPETEVMPIGDAVTGHPSETDFCKREPDQCDEDDGGK